MDKTLQGPVDINMDLLIEGVRYQVRGGSVTPQIPEALVPTNLYSLGFYWADKPTKQARFVDKA